MPVEAQEPEDHPDIAAMVEVIESMLDGRPALEAIDVILTALSRVYAHVLVETEKRAGEANEERIGKLVDEYAAMLKQTVLMEVLDLKGRN